MEIRKFLYLLMAAAMLGCSSDYDLIKPAVPVEPGVVEPEIDVDPISHSFGALNAGSEISDVIITIKNIGNGELNVADVYLAADNANFNVTSFTAGIVEPNDTTEIVVSYSPGTYEVNTDTLKISSNDVDEPIVDVVLDGSGDAPVITVDPEYFDFGTVLLGCDGSVKISIGNSGNASLSIDDLEYFSSIPDDFSLVEYESDHGPPPIVVGPGDSIELIVNYIPIDLLDDSAYVEITSNDPTTPVAYSKHDGLGDYENWVLDNFTQDGEVSVDILFVIDNSGSMYSNQTNLKNNFDSFINAFGVAGVDYHIALITTDDETFVGDIITSATPYPVTEFNDQVDIIGTTGWAIEKGLWFSYAATTPGGDAAPSSTTGFFRETAKFVVVYVSDESDASASLAGDGGSTTMTPTDYSAHLLSLKSSSDLVVAHAVAGDHPSGCTTNGGAQFGDGYYNVVGDLGGTFMSICASDWSVTMDTLARESMAIMSFPLSDNPIEETIAVSVDGVLSTDWVYDSSANSISFTVAPADGSSIDIQYAIWADCFGGEGEDTGA